MKPKNFPERKRQRQLSALKRLEENLKENWKRRSNDYETARMLREVTVLKDHTATSRRSVRTKKKRAGRSIPAR